MLHAPPTTGPGPGTGCAGVLIYLDKQALQVYDVFKRRLRLSDGAVSRTLGAPQPPVRRRRRCSRRQGRRAVLRSPPSRQPPLDR